MTNNYFNDSILSQFSKNKKNTKLLLLIFSVLFSISFALFIVFASFETKTLFSIIGSIVCSILFCVLIGLLFKLHYMKDFLFRFNLIKENKADKIECEIVEVSNVITLQNNDRVREITIAINKQTKVLFLYDFIEPTFKNKEHVKLLVVDDFIKGVMNNEN